MAGPVGEGHQREHYGHFYQYADHSDQRRAGVEAEQANGHRHRQLEEIGSADQGAGGGHIERYSPEIGRRVSDGKNTVGLNQ